MFLLLLRTTCCLATLFSPVVQVTADRPNTIIVKNARFQFYNDELVRLEWSPGGSNNDSNLFDDLSTAAVPCRTCVRTPPIVNTHTWNNFTVS